jgi:SagB-type dehydrogenase family enzyme
MRRREPGDKHRAQHPRQLYRRAPTVVSYWKDRRCVFHNYLTAARVIGPPIVTDVLHFFDRWRTADDLVRAVPSALPLIQRLAEETLLDRWDGIGDPPAATAPWSAWGPAAGFLHFSTKDDFDTQQDLETAERAYRIRLERNGAPAPCKHSPQPGVDLERPFGRNGLEDVLARRRTWREFGDRPLDMPLIARLLWWVWGVHGWLDDGHARSALRTSPSAGARQVIEVYLVACRTNGLEPGLYHYEMDRHRLVRLPRPVSARTLKAFVPRQWWFHDAAALFVMTAAFDRIQLRYPFGRAYRSVLLEAGHFCQTFCLLAESLHLAPFCTHALADRTVETALDLDGVQESVIYATGVGHRPPDGVWRPWPAHEPGHPYRAPHRGRA